jgi:uncharacterized protein YprB with RNaseH-like and TPR domain
LHTINDERKILLWDIECGDLDADWDRILCIGYKWFGRPGRPKIVSIRDYPGWKRNPYNDRRVVADFVKVFEGADIHVTHNGTLFDVPYLKARMLYNRLGYLPKVAHVDTRFVARSNLKISSRSLQVVSEFLGCKAEKTPIRRRVWLAAKRGSERALRYVEAHCRADIEVLEEVYARLRPFMARHPVIGDYGACHVCGSRHLQRRGYFTTTLRGRQVRIKCEGCGSWSHAPESRFEKFG